MSTCEMCRRFNVPCSCSIKTAPTILVRRNSKICDPLILGFDQHQQYSNQTVQFAKSGAALPDTNLSKQDQRQEKESFARSKEKNPLSPGSLQELFGLGSLFDDITAPTLTPEDMNMWKLPTPPQSPTRDELPDCEESIDLTQFGKLDTDILDKKSDAKKNVADFDPLDTDFSELIDFMNNMTEIEEFSPDDELHSLSQSLQKGFYYYKEDECVMMRGDIMWSESSRDPSPVRNKESTHSPVWDPCSALNVALQSDVLPPFPALTKSRDELSYRERSVALGTDTPSDSEEEIDVVNTEESDRRPSITQISAEEIRVRVTAKRAAAAVEPEVQIEVKKPRTNCYCPSTSSSPGSSPHHHHHMPVDHHNYSLPPSPGHMSRRSPKARSRHSSPESRVVRRDSIQAQRSALNAQVVEQALQQAMMLQTGEGPKRAQAMRKGQKGQKRGKNGRKSHAVNTTCQYVQVAASAAVNGAQAASTVSLHSGGRRRNDVLQYEDDGDRRNQHNVLERNRRILLSGKFTSLKLLVPSIMHQEKASKVIILNNAENYVRELRSQEAHLLREHRALKARNDMLKKKLAELSRRC